MIVQAGIDWITSFMIGSPGAAPAYMALGDAGSPVLMTDTKLYHEVSRKVIGNVYTDTSGTVVFESFYDRPEDNFSWREVGIFAGGNATPDTGILIGRGLINEDKDDTKTATITWELSLVNK